MLNFIIAHEFGHIVHGHVLANSEDNFIEELYADETTNKDNWLTQLREFDSRLLCRNAEYGHYTWILERRQEGIKCNL